MGLTRVPNQRFAEVIGASLDLMPDRIKGRLTHVQFVCGVSPLFAGLHTFTSASYGRSYSSTAHCCYPEHLTLVPRPERVTTVMLPTLDNLTPRVVTHELGHALDQSIAEDHGPIAAVSWYGATSQCEAFAEAFAAWVHPDYGDQGALAGDHRTLDLFDRLAS